MKFALLFSILVPCFAMAEARYECVPASPHQTVAKAVVFAQGADFEIELWGHEQLISKTVAEYSDDIDAVSYFSESADLNVFFYWSEMQQDGEADGEIALSATSLKSEYIRARCKSL